VTSLALLGLLAACLFSSALLAMIRVNILVFTLGSAVLLKPAVAEALAAHRKKKNKNSSAAAEAAASKSTSSPNPAAASSSVSAGLWLKNLLGRVPDEPELVHRAIASLEGPLGLEAVQAEMAAMAVKPPPAR
jgi:hypothetical protein